MSLPFPVIVKPSREDASVGIYSESVVTTVAAQTARIAHVIAQYRQPALVERYIEGREIYVSLLGRPGAEPQVLPFFEIDFSALPPDRPRIVSFEGKWVESSVEYAGTKPVPCVLPEALQNRVAAAARGAFEALELRDYGRVDIRLDAEGIPYVIDVNPNCDLSHQAGGFSRAARAAGLTYDDVVLRILDLALSRRHHADTIPLAARSRRHRRARVFPLADSPLGPSTPARPGVPARLRPSGVGLSRASEGLDALAGLALAPFSPFRLAPVAIAFVGLLAVGCHRSASVPSRPRPRLGVVEIHDESANPHESGEIDVSALAGTLRSALEASGLVQVNTGDAGVPESAVVRVVGRVAVEFVEVDKKGIVRAAVNLRLSTRPSDAAGALGDDLAAGGEQAYQPGPGVDRRQLGQSLADRTARDLLAGFIARARLATAPPNEIHAAIAGGTGAMREEAIRVAGTRGMRDEGSTLLPLLQDDDESMRDAALGALIALRDRRAVGALTASRSLRDRHEMRKILEAIAILGGDEARDYLSFVAETHDDEEIRRLASDARQRLGRHEDAGGS